jgi:pyrroloquinoline quinone (PQQ) biosynthesis protein C
MPHAFPDVLSALREELERHPVTRHGFFRAFRDRHLSDAQLRRFLRQYQYFCHRFVKLLEGLLYRTPLAQLEMRIELTKTLHSELGAGQPERAHIRLLNRFAAVLGLTVETLETTEPLPAVTAYLGVLQRLFLDGDYLTALGAELAVEITAAAEFRYFYPGLLKYERFQEDDLAFFKLHLQEEQAHGDWLLAAVRHTARGPEDYAKVAAGARETAWAWSRFWDGMYTAVFEEAPEPCEPNMTDA